jgi:hypothetical protein
MTAYIFAIIHVGMSLAALLLGVSLYLLFKEVTKGK